MRMKKTEQVICGTALCPTRHLLTGGNDVRQCSLVSSHFLCASSRPDELWAGASGWKGSRRGVTGCGQSWRAGVCLLAVCAVYVSNQQKRGGGVWWVCVGTKDGLTHGTEVPLVSRGAACLL